MAAPNSERFRKRLARATVGADRARQVLVNAVDATILVRLMLAVVLAFGLWVFVTLRNNPEVTQTLRPRPVEVRGLTNSRPHDAPRWRSSSRRCPDRTDRATHQCIRRAGLPVAPSQRVPVKVDLPLGVRVVSLTPEELVIDLDHYGQLDFPVIMAVPTTLPVDVRMDQPILEPRAVTVSGARSTLTQIARVVVRPDLGGDPTDRTRVVRPIPLDIAGREVTGPKLEIVPATIRVTLPALRVTGQKSVPIKIIVEGQPAAGYQLETIGSTPKVVTVAGEADALEGVTALETEPITITDRQQSLIQPVRLKVPPGIAAEQTMVRSVGISAIQARRASPSWW
jgi:hypothetical protein